MRVRLLRFAFRFGLAFLVLRFLAMRLPSFVEHPMVRRPSEESSHLAIKVVEKTLTKRRHHAREKTPRKSEAARRYHRWRELQPVLSDF